MAYRSALALAGLASAAIGASHSITTLPAAHKVAALAAASSPAAAAGETPLPLTAYTYASPSNLPYKVNPYAYLRGPQAGYNICNSTTEGDASMCQTAYINDISDFCLWGSPDPASTIGDVEAKTVAYCTKPGHGTRVFPAGSILGVQFTRAPGYIQVVGWIDQTRLGLTADDSGGELDPHGADLLGNPLGGVVFSNGLPSSRGTVSQVLNWNNFVGGGAFCFKACDKSGLALCENRYDLLGCTYNMPADYTAINGTFTSCESDNQMIVGQYVENGQTLTYSQPETVPTSVPYQPVIPKSSNCQTFTSSQLYSFEKTLSSATPTGNSAGAQPTGNGGGSSNSGGNGTSAAPAPFEAFGVIFALLVGGLVAGAFAL